MCVCVCVKKPSFPFPFPFPYTSTSVVTGKTSKCLTSYIAMLSVLFYYGTIVRNSMLKKLPIGGVTKLKMASVLETK